MKQIKKLAQQAFLLSLALGIVLGTAASVLLSSRIPVWMGAEPAIQETASRYFFIISLPMIFRSTSTIMGAALRAVQNTRTPMLINVAANCSNIVLNYLFIYALGYGVAGAGHRLGSILCIIRHVNAPVLPEKRSALLGVA